MLSKVLFIKSLKTKHFFRKERVQELSLTFERKLYFFLTGVLVLFDTASSTITVESMSSWKLISHLFSLCCVNVLFLSPSNPLMDDILRFPMIFFLNIETLVLASGVLLAIADVEFDNEVNSS